MFLPPGTSSKLEKICALLLPSKKFIKDYSNKKDVIEELTNAMLGTETCYVTYHSFFDNKEKNFAIDPLHFFENNGGLYIFVNTTTFSDIRILAVERILKIKKSGKIFKYPEGFNPEKLLENSFSIIYDDPVDVKIWFSANQARYIKERKWAKHQSIKDQQDGSIILSLKTSGWWEIKKWVLSYGQEACVREPEDLRREIADEIQSMHNNYLPLN